MRPPCIRSVQQTAPEPGPDHGEEGQRRRAQDWPRRCYSGLAAAPRSTALTETFNLQRDWSTPWRGRALPLRSGPALRRAAQAVFSVASGPVGPRVVDETGRTDRRKPAPQRRPCPGKKASDSAPGDSEAAAAPRRSDAKPARARGKTVILERPSKSGHSCTNETLNPKTRT